MSDDIKKRTTRFEERLKKILEEDVDEVIENINKRKTSSSKKGEYNGENKTDI